VLYNSVIFIGLNLVHTVVIMMIIINRKKAVMYHICAVPENGPFGLKYVVNKYSIYIIGTPWL